MRAGRWAWVGAVVVLAGCGSSPVRRAASTTVGPTAAATTTVAAPTTTSTLPVTPVTTWQLGDDAGPGNCLGLAQPASFPVPTYIDAERDGTGRVAVVRAADGVVLQTLSPPCPKRNGPQRWVQRTPTGGVLVWSFDARSIIPAWEYFWFDPATGVKFVGDDAVMSPDGSRVAAHIRFQSGETIIRQYDAVNGRILSDLVVGRDNGALAGSAGAFLGFDWSADGASLVVAFGGNGDKAGGLYVIPRDAHDIPGAPVVANPPSPAGSVFTRVLTDPAALANGHVVALWHVGQEQRTTWQATVVDVDLASGAMRTVLGSPDDSFAGRQCERVPIASRAARPGPCLFQAPGRIDAQGSDALVSDWLNNVWLYDGTTVRRVSPDDSHTVYW